MEFTLSGCGKPMFLWRSRFLCGNSFIMRCLPEIIWGNEIGLANHFTPFSITLKLLSIYSLLVLAWRDLHVVLLLSKFTQAKFVLALRVFTVDCFYMICIAAVCWGIWTMRKKVSFEGHEVRSYVEVILNFCSWLYWSGYDCSWQKTRKFFKV